MSRAATSAQSVSTTCPWCSSESATVVWRAQNNELGEPVRFDVVRCDGCGLTYTSPMPSLAELMPFYNTGIYEKDERRPLALADSALSMLADVRLREIEDLKSPGRLLDVGAGKGRFLHRARRRGWSVRGVEPVPGSVTLARARYGVDVVEESLTGAHFREGSFDVVTMWHVLEHIADPRSELAEVSRVLTDDGVLALEVPNFASLQAWVGQDRWFHLMLPHHLVHYTPVTLRAVIEGSGFEIVRWRTFSLEHGPFGMLQSLINRTGGERDFLFHRLKRVPHRGGRQALAGDVARTAIVGVAGAIPAAIAESAAAAAGRGAAIRVLARKRPHGQDVTSAPR